MWKWTLRSVDDKTHMLCFSSFYICVHVVQMPWIVHSTIPLLFMIHSPGVSGRVGRLIQLWNPTLISRSIVTKCRCPITILFHWAGLGLYNFYHMQSSITVILFCSIGLVCTKNDMQWTWLVSKIINHQSQSFLSNTRDDWYYILSWFLGQTYYCQTNDWRMGKNDLLLTLMDAGASEKRPSYGRVSENLDAKWF